MDMYKFYSIVNDEGNGILDRIRNLDYHIDEEEKKTIVNVANQIKEGKSDTRLFVTFLELVSMMYNSVDEHLCDFANHIVYLATQDYYTW